MWKPIVGFRGCLEHALKAGGSQFGQWVIEEGSPQQTLN
jgi:hypothetical protein